MLSSIKEARTFLQNRKNLGIRPGLIRMEIMLDKLHHPEQVLHAVHIAGTNGKGSTLTYLKQVLMDQGYKVGSFVSPSMGEIQDHIFIQNNPIPDEDFMNSLNELLPIVEEMDREENGPTEFEIMVMIAILYFKQKTDIVLFEAGMGGKEDSTNVLSPILSIITNVGFDHMSFLGNSISEIAMQKAGIIKEGIPIVSGVMQSEAKDVIRKVASENHAPLYSLKKEFDIPSGSTYYSKQTRIEDIQFGMNGPHQTRNGALAIQALELILHQKFDEKKVKESLAKARLPGRFEQVYDRPKIILDGAHNLEGVQACIETAEMMYPNNSKHVLFAAFQDKPVNKMMEYVKDYVESMTLTSFDHPRAASLNYFKDQLNNNHLVTTDNWQAFIRDFVVRAYEHDVLLITGSLHFISKVRHFMSLFDY